MGADVAQPLGGPMGGLGGAGAPPEAILVAQSLAVGYGPRPLVGPVSFAIARGAFVLIEGPNGVGKSTLLKTLIGLLPPLSGQYRWESVGNGLRFVPQTRTLDAMLPATVTDVLRTGLHRKRGWASLWPVAEGEEIRDALHTIGMYEMRRRLFRELSEGQKQLVLLARALLGEPQVLLLDEPSASMDPEREQQAVDLLDHVRLRHGVTVVMIAHGSQAAREVATHLVRMGRGGGFALEAIGEAPGPEACAHCQT